MKKKQRTRTCVVFYYRDTAGLWRWRFYAGNGRIVADSGQGYASLRDCRDVGIVRTTKLREAVLR